SKNIATLASEKLKNPNASKIQKQLAGSALSQRDRNKETSEKMDEIAAKVLQSQKYSDETKTLAATVLSQANGEEK
ncbi:MAG: hypothetical protein EOM54_14310, partial [Clostridia bacterium]|nr:hypothetical protein [Clostridia bacterium]